MYAYPVFSPKSKVVWQKILHEPEVVMQKFLKYDRRLVFFVE